MARGTAFLHDERCFWHTTGVQALFLPIGGWLQPPTAGGAAESPESKRRIKALLDVSGLTAQLDARSAEPATAEDLLRIHTADYLRRFREVSDAGGGEVGHVAPFGPGSFEIACLSAGLAIEALDSVLAGRNRNAFALSRPPGHHCLRDVAMGFCLLANIAIAVEAAIAKHGLTRVAVVDWDVHHGNGTQSIFYDRADVLTISLHQENWFPPNSGAPSERGEGAGEGFNINVPLLPGAGHESYLHAMRRIVIPALRRYRPEAIVVASGLDANNYDPLARMMLTSESFRELTRMIVALADELCGGRVAVVHEGGYAEAYVPFCGIAVVEELAGIRTAVADPFLEAVPIPSNARFNAFQAAIIDEMAEGFGLQS